MQITPEAEYSTLLLLSQSGPVLMVEGDDDILIFEHLTTPKVKIIASSGGKSRVLDVAKIAETEGLDRARFLIDSDYDSYKQEMVTYPSNVTSSEHHDCFIDLIAQDFSPLQTTIHSKLVRANKQSHGSSTTNDDFPTIQVLANAIRIASALAAVRIVSTHFSLKLNLQRYNIFNLHPDTITAHHAYEQLRRDYTFPAEIENQHLQMIQDTLESFKSSTFPRVGDHDLLRAVSRILKLDKIQTKEEELRYVTLCQISSTALRNTRWCQDLTNWCHELGFELYAERTSISYKDLPLRTDRPEFT